MIELSKNDLGESAPQFAASYLALFPGTEEEERVGEPNVEVPRTPEYVTDYGRACVVGHRSLGSKLLFIPEKSSEMSDIVFEIGFKDGWDHGSYSWHRIPEDVLEKIT
jgi:hypothetical protein